MATAEQTVVPGTVPEAVLRAARTLPSPALVYSAETVTETVGRLRQDLAVIPGARPCFAVKANRFAPLLRHLAGLGLGADVAGQVELEAATAAGFDPVYATAPALSRAEFLAIDDSGALLDVDSVGQLRQLVDAGWRDREIGLRIRTPVSPSDRDGVRPAGSGPLWSRFGVDPAARELHQLLSGARLRVTRLHAHTGELATPSRVLSLVRTLLACRRLFPSTATINVGGGLTLLYADRQRARQAWDGVARLMAEHRREQGSAPELVVEPGMLLVALAGYLVVTVRATGQLPGGPHTATADASGWSLLSWSAPRVAAVLPERHEQPVPYDLAGASCYENDYLLRSVSLPLLREGDRVVLTSAGAYVSSMARVMHGQPVPEEWLLSGEEVTGGDGDTHRVPG